MIGNRRTARVLATACSLALLSGCGGVAGHDSESPTTAPSTAIDEADKTSGPASTSVSWSERDDFEIWQPPLPPDHDGWTTEPPDRWPGLRVRLVLPSRVQPGETVDYAVRIHNQSEEAVDLRPCGGYRQRVHAVGEGLAAEPVEGGESTFRLNCDGSPRLPPGRGRTYDMRLVVPEGLSGDEVLFTWGFVDNMPDYDAQAWVELSG